MAERAAVRSLTSLRAVVVLWIGLLAGFAAGIEWIKTRPSQPAPSGRIDLVGAGATFPFPLYRRWFSEYRDATGVRINYFSVGSGEGIRLLLQEQVDFGATDRPLSPAERTEARCGPFELPTVIGAVAVAVNLPRITTAIQLDAEVLAAIYLGRIQRWDDERLRALNPRLALPAAPIVVVHRARTSGTSEVFADYLESSASWRAVQSGSTTEWPVGERVEGNEGVAGQVRVTEGAVGFVELSYAQQARLSVAHLRNVAGRFVAPDSIGLASTASEMLQPETADTLHGLVGARNPQAYPIVAITRLVADHALRDSTRAAHFIAFARWALRDGARAATALGYAPLPAAVTQRQLRRLEALRPGSCPSGEGR